MWNTQAQQSFSDAGKPRGGLRPGAGQAEGEACNALLRKVLVVDDEPDLADFAAALLAAHGLEVAVAYSAHEAVHILASDDRIDALVSDVVMPGMTGLQLADVVADIYPRIKVVLTSGYTLPELLANRERPYLFATKPYRIETILNLLRS